MANRNSRRIADSDRRKRKGLKPSKHSGGNVQHGPNAFNHDGTIAERRKKEAAWLAMKALEKKSQDIKNAEADDAKQAPKPKHSPRR